MKEIKIIQYSSFYHDELYAYIEKNYINRPKQYIDYCLNNLTDNIQGTLLCLNEKDEIVGCQLCFPTKALIKGEEQYIAWGHDLRIDEDYRGGCRNDVNARSVTTPSVWHGIIGHK